MKDKILEKVGAFPPLDDTVTQVMAVCNDPEGSIMDLVKIVQKDPMTTANILKAANSPLYGFSHEVKDIQHSISLFGMETVKGFAFSSFLQKKPNLDLSPYNIESKEFSMVSQKQNAFVSRWYKGHKSKLGILSIASFLMEIGKIVLSDIMIECNKGKEFQEYIKECQSISDIKTLEENVFNITNEEVTTMILKEWNFNPSTYDTIQFLHNPSNIDESIREFAASLKAIKTIITTSNFAADDSLNSALKVVEEFNLNRDIFVETAENLLGLTTA
jgi:HD-like signal output (HDOD) protein